MQIPVWPQVAIEDLPNGLVSASTYHLCKIYSVVGARENLVVEELKNKIKNFRGSNPRIITIHDQ